MTCPHCTNDDQSRIEEIRTWRVPLMTASKEEGTATKVMVWRSTYLCNNCSKEWDVTEA